MKLINNRFLVIIILLSIVGLGVFKNVVMQFFANIVNWLAYFFGLADNGLFRIIKKAAYNDEVREQSIGWILYYPVYFFLHILFITVLFSKNKKTRNYLIIGLSTLVSTILFLWILFLRLGQVELATFFRNQFRNLFGLPFILLIIEGGKILYYDIENRLKNNSNSL